MVYGDSGSNDSSKILGLDMDGTIIKAFLFNFIFDEYIKYLL